MRSAVELTKDWRTDRVLRRLEAMLIVADKDHTLVLTGNGDVLEPEHGLAAIGSGGAYAQSAALALLHNTDMAPADIGVVQQCQRRSEEHTSELQSLMRISYAVFCLKKKNQHHTHK